MFCKSSICGQAATRIISNQCAKKGISHSHALCAEVEVSFYFSNYFLNGDLDLLSTHLSEVDIFDEVLMEGLGVNWRVESTAGISSYDMVIVFVNSMIRHRVKRVWHLQVK